MTMVPFGITKAKNVVLDEAMKILDTFNEVFSGFGSKTDPVAVEAAASLYVDLDELIAKAEAVKASIKEEYLLPEGKNIICSSRGAILQYTAPNPDREVNSGAVFDELKKRKDWGTLKANFKVTITSLLKIFSETEAQQYSTAGKQKSPFFKVVRG